MTTDVTQLEDVSTFAVGGAVFARVPALEKELLKLPQANIITEHIFNSGVYERKITIPPWVVLTGAEHKTDYRVRLECGTIAVTTDDGVKIITGPLEFDAKAGTQRAGRVFDEEVVWVDIYPNPDDCVDLSVLEKRLYVVPDCGLADSRTEIQKAKVDYGAFLYQIGMTQEEMDKIVHIECDLMEMPDGVFTEMRDSSIHGKGLFATVDFEAGDVVCPGRIDGMRTPAGRYINHSPNYNIIPEKVGDDIYAVAACRIIKGDELLVDYRSSMRVNFGITVQGELS